MSLLPGSSKAEQEVEWVSAPITEQVSSASITNLTAGSIVPTFPPGSARVRAILVACIHIANQSNNTHHIGIKVQGQKASGGYSNLIDLTSVPPVGLVGVDGSSDGWVGLFDITSLVDTSAATYTFRFAVDSDNAAAVNYTTEFNLVLVYI